MGKIISIHSYRGGTGKSNITANIAAILAMSGKKVAVVDTDIQSPGIHVIFNMHKRKPVYTLNDYLWRKCEIEEAAIPVSSEKVDYNGNLYLIPSSTDTGDIARVLHDGYNVEQLSDGFERLIKKLNLDFLLIDTHPGLNEETLLSIAISDKLLVIMRPDQQDVEGTSITLQVADRLQVEQIAVVINKVPESIDFELLQNEIQKLYGFPVVAVFPHNDQLMLLGSKNIFCVEYPLADFTERYRNLAAWIAGIKRL